MRNTGGLESRRHTASPPRMAAPAAEALLALLVLSSCSQGGESGATCSPKGSELHLVALNTHKFNTDCLAAPANKRFTIDFENRDESGHGNHNVSIKGGGELLFKGEVVLNGGHSTTYEVKPLQPGSYEFFCTPHPFMQGRFIVK
jgi:plastocyanin